MKIRVEQPSPNRLQLQAWGPAWLVMLLWTLTVSGLFGLCQTLVIHCSRTTGRAVTCVVERRLFTICLSTKTLFDFAGAGLESNRHAQAPPNEFAPPATRVALSDRNGTSMPLTLGYDTAVERQQQVVAELNDFLKAPEKARADVRLPVHPALWSLEALLLFGALGVTLGGWTRVRLDKDLDQITVECLGIGRSRRRICQLSAVDHFAISQRDANRPDIMESVSAGPIIEDPENRADDQRTVLVLAARLRNGRELVLVDRMFGGQAGLDFVRHLERFRKTTVTQPTAPTTDSSIGLGKRCAVCGGDCTGGSRLKDEAGRYYHPQCYDQGAVSRHAAA